jgi:succinate-semialdehyde dehydrogenase/glutarate-semialdehyde dehydrogenase
MQQITNQNLIKETSYVGGSWVSSKLTFEVENPSLGNILGRVSEADESLVNQAIEAADQALATWQDLSFDQRRKILKRWGELMLENKQGLARLMTLEQGKPLEEASGEILHSIAYINLYADIAESVSQSKKIESAPNQNALVFRRPMGVVTAITPWNFPCSMVIRKASAALAAGCSVVLKPSELTPYTALAIAELSQQAGLPSGVFNVVVGTNAQAIGEILTQHPKVAKFSFTGSTQVGRKLLQQCAPGVKKTSMELGGNAPFMVFSDADLDLAVTGAIASRFRNSGQTCMCANRFIVDESIADEFIEKLKNRLSDNSNPEKSNKALNLGPLINREAVDKMNGLISQAVSEGAKLVTGGEQNNQPGYFFKPTIIDQVTPGMSLFKSEIFGPIVSVIRFSDEEQAIQLANDTVLGLSGYAYTRCERRMERIASQLQVGMLGLNESRLSNPAAPFGGMKQSGMGREGGTYGVEEYLDYQYVCTTKDG